MFEGWAPYDAAELERIGVPANGVRALGGHGLPAGDFYGRIVREPGRELQVAQLPGGQRAAFLARVFDDDERSCWLNLDDTSVWVCHGVEGEPFTEVYQINATVEAFQEILAIWCDFWDSADGLHDTTAHDALVCDTIVRAVSVEPGIFTDETQWWAVAFEEVEYSMERSLRGDAALYELVRRDESGAWVLDHPGYEDADGD